MILTQSAINTQDQLQLCTNLDHVAYSLQKKFSNKKRNINVHTFFKIGKQIIWLKRNNNNFEL